MAQILIAGDTCPVGRAQPLFAQGDAEALVGDLLPVFHAADLVVANLECPLIREPSPQPKAGPTLGAPVACVAGLTALGVDVAGLANNHILDHGPEGLRATLETLAAHEVEHVGAGVNRAAADRFLVREVAGTQVGLRAMAEHEFGIAGPNTPGASPMDLIRFVRRIAEDRATCDVLIVLLHAGLLHHPYPSPPLRELCRFLVEQGVDAVVCQHSHCVGSMEIYRGAPIIYGQGNFIFDAPERSAAWQEGLVVLLTTGEGGALETELIPVRQRLDKPGVRRMPEAEGAAFLDAFHARGPVVADSARLEAVWQDYCRRRRRYYLNGIHGKAGLVRRLAAKLGLLHYLTPPAALRQQLHLVRCESHREALTTVLTQETAALDSAPCRADAVPGSSEPGRTER